MSLLEKCTNISLELLCTRCHGSQVALLLEQCRLFATLDGVYCPISINIVFHLIFIIYKVHYPFCTVYTPEQLAEKYSNIAFLLYCLILATVVALHHSIYR